MRHAGILAYSADGSALCFLTFCREALNRFGAHEHPDVTLDSIAMGRTARAWDLGQWSVIRAALATSVERLASAGAEFFACPDNSAHLALESPGNDLALPGLNIADVVADQAGREGRRRVGVLGTRYTMDGPVYRRALAACGIDPMVPEPHERETINRIIFDELICGIVSDESRRAYCAVIENLAARGCDAVALVCTEIPLLVTAEVSALPILDSTRLLALAAFEVGIGERPLPTWRGGPVNSAPGPHRS